MARAVPHCPRTSAAIHRDYRLQLERRLGHDRDLADRTFTPVNGKRKAGSCGMPMPGIIIKFLSLDKPTQYVPLGERGELCIRGPM